MIQGIEMSEELDLPIRRDERLSGTRAVRLDEVVHHPCSSVIPEGPLRKFQWERIGSLPGCGELIGHFAARAFVHA